MEKTIAWIEDDADEIEAVIKPLVNAGIKLRYYRSYKAAIENLDEIRSCDLILLDLIIPPGERAGIQEEDLDSGETLGKRLLERFRQQDLIDCPIIVLSAFVDSIDETEKERLNAVVTFKPVRPSVLKEKVYELLGLEKQ